MRLEQMKLKDPIEIKGRITRVFEKPTTKGNFYHIIDVECGFDGVVPVQWFSGSEMKYKVGDLVKVNGFVDEYNEKRHVMIVEKKGGKIELVQMQEVTDHQVSASDSAVNYTSTPGFTTTSEVYTATPYDALRQQMIAFAVKQKQSWEDFLKKLEES